jgi:hypothetical protein
MKFPRYASNANGPFDEMIMGPRSAFAVVAPVCGDAVDVSSVFVTAFFFADVFTTGVSVVVSAEAGRASWPIAPRFTPDLCPIANATIATTITTTTETAIVIANVFFVCSIERNNQLNLMDNKKRNLWQKVNHVWQRKTTFRKTRLGGFF